MVTVAWLNFWSCCFSSASKCSSGQSFYLMWLFSTVFSTTDLRCLKASETTERLRDEQIIKLPWDSHAFLIYVWCVTAVIGLIAQKKGRFGLRSLSFHFFFWHANPQGRSKSSPDLVSSESAHSKVVCQSITTTMLSLCILLIYSILSQLCKCTIYFVILLPQFFPIWCKKESRKSSLVLTIAIVIRPPRPRLSLYVQNETFQKCLLSLVLRFATLTKSEIKTILTSVAWRVERHVRLAAWRVEIRWIFWNSLTTFDGQMKH